MKKAGILPAFSFIVYHLLSAIIRLSTKGGLAMNWLDKFLLKHEDAVKRVVAIRVRVGVIVPACVGG